MLFSISRADDHGKICLPEFLKGIKACNGGVRISPPSTNPSIYDAWKGTSLERSKDEIFYSRLV